MKHWTEPAGRFIVKLPINWYYLNNIYTEELEESLFSFGEYSSDANCMQISSYPLSEKSINKAIPIQSANSKLEWVRESIKEQPFSIRLYFAQVEDIVIIVKYIYSSNQENSKEIFTELELVENCLKNFCVVPQQDRKLASDLNRYDNFFTSLAASQDLIVSAINKQAYIEIIILAANQIDAFLRLSIVVKYQLDNKIDEIEVKYLYQGNLEKGITERDVYKTALDLGIIDQSLFQRLGDLYDIRNRVVHRYIISYLTTKRIQELVAEYLEISEGVRLILSSLEQQQKQTDFGIYGKRLFKQATINNEFLQRIYSSINEKHLLKEFERNI